MPSQRDADTALSKLPDVPLEQIQLLGKEKDVVEPKFRKAVDIVAEIFITPRHVHIAAAIWKGGIF